MAGIALLKASMLDFNDVDSFSNSAACAGGSRVMCVVRHVVAARHGVSTSTSTSCTSLSPPLPLPFVEKENYVSLA